MPKVRILTATFAALAAGTVFAAAGTLDDIKARGTLVCGVLGTSQPYGFINQQTKVVEGYEVDLCNAVAESLGVKAEAKVTSSEARIPELMQGRVDVLAALISYSPQRAEQVDFSNSYLREGFGFLVLKEVEAKRLADLDGKRLGINKGNFLEALIKQKLPQASIVAYEEQPAAFVAMQQGKVVGIAGRFSSLRVLQLRAGEGGRPTEILDDPITTQNAGFVVRKGDTEFRDYLNKVLAELESSGKAAALYDKWLGSGSTYKFERNFKVGAPIDE